MVKIRKGKMTLTIPAGAVRKYTKAGWEPIQSPQLDETHDEGDFTPEFENEDENEDAAMPEDDISYEDEDVEYVDPEELAQRPLGELDKEELRILAEYKGIDTSALSTAKQFRAAIRALE